MITPRSADGWELGGVAELLATDWVKAETLRHLHDELPYRKVTQQDWYDNRLNVINSREKLLSIYSRFIPKIHKDPMVERPIAASHSYITRPISIFIDELTKPKIRMPTVLRDSGELIQLLEDTVLPTTDCFLVTADVVSLYPNVDTKKALTALDLLLREARVPETPLLIQLATWENKTSAETFPKFPSVLRVIDSSDRNLPIAATSVIFQPSLRHAIGLW